MNQVQEHHQMSLRRSSSSCLNTTKINPSNSSSFSRSTSSTTFTSNNISKVSPRWGSDTISNKTLVLRNNSSNDNNNNSNSNSPLSLWRVRNTGLRITAFLRSFLHVFSFAVPTCRMLSLSSSVAAPQLGRKVTGTLFGHRKGHVTFAVQDDPRSNPALLVELAVSTSALVREMSSGLVRIALECGRGEARGKHAPKLLVEPAWTMYCNGRKCGYATTRACTEFDWHVLGTVQSVSVGAGVIPLVENRMIGSGSGSGSEGELLYMRAKFERVVGSRDSEAFYMLNPDGNGGPELSIFLLRL